MYKLIYDFSDRSFNISAMLIPLTVTAIGVILFVFALKNRRQAKNSEQKGKAIYNLIFSIFFLTFSSVVTIIVFTLNLSSYSETKKVYNAKSYSIVEGKVENFHPMPESGHDSERFSVKGIRFEFSDYDFSDYGYNNATSKGGAIKPELYVRIAYLSKEDKNIILRLEIKVDSK